MYIRRALAAALVAFILCGIPVAADHSDAQYEGVINIANAGAAVSGVTVLLETNTAAFIAAGMLDASFNNVWFDSASGNSMAFMPKPGATDEWYFYHTGNLAAGATTLSYLYMGGPDMAPPIRYLPGATGMSTADAATLEPGSDWTAECKGYLALPADNSAAPRNILYKADAVWLAGMQDGVMAMLCSGAATFSQFYSTGTGNSDPGAIWTQEDTAYDNNVTTGADLGSVAATTWSDYLNIDLDYAPNPTVAAIQVYAEYDAASWTQYDLDAYYGGAWHHVYEGTYTNLTYDVRWLPGAYPVSDVRIRFYNSAGSAQSETDLLREVQMLYNHNNRSIIFAATDSGSHTVQMDYANPAVTLSLDGVAEATTNHPAAAAVNNNANSWACADDASFAYLEYLKQWQGATLRQQIAWENDTTFTDLSGNGNDATPSFPAASSDPDVTATLASMEPTSPAEAPGTSTDSGSGMAGGLPDEPDNLFDEMDVDHLPGAAVVNALLDAGGIPRALFWFFAVFVGLILLTLFTYGLSRSLMAASLVAGAGLVFCSKVGIVPYWVTVPLVIIAVAVLVKEKMSPL